MSIKDDRVDLVIADGGDAAGPTQRLVWELATRLSRTRYHLEVWLSGAPGMDPFAESLAHRDVTVQRMAGPSQGWRTTLGKWLKLSRRPPDLLHLHEPFGPARRWAGALAEASYEARLVITQSGAGILDENASGLLDRRIASRADALLVPSCASGERWIRELGVARETLRTLAPGIDAPDADDEGDGARELRQALGAGLFRPLWLCPETLAPGHGHETLLDALVHVRDAGVPFVMLWSGRGMLRAELERGARDRGLEDRVRFASADLPPGVLLAAADVVVFPGPRQDDPLPLLEAMVRGRTVVASAAGVARELIEHHSSGRLVRPGDVDDLAVVLVTLARHQDGARRLGALAAAHAREEHAWPRIVETLEAVYDEVLGLTSFAPDPLQAAPAKP